MSRPIIDLTGMIFNEWTVLERATSIHWRCRCSCGKEKLIQPNSLKTGKSKSCGCKGSDWCRKHGMDGTSTYNIWSVMKQRCHNINHGLYQNYGGKGISVCDRWRESFNNFHADMGTKPEGMSLDRIDPKGNYSPENCRWASSKEQNRNKINTIYLEYKGERKPLAEWAEIKGMRRKTLRERLKMGWTVERALETPIRHKQ